MCSSPGQRVGRRPRRPSSRLLDFALFLSAFVGMLSPHSSWAQPAFDPARGILLHAFTPIYLAAGAHADDPVVALVDPSRRRTLIAERLERDAACVYRWDIHLQGERETVFFDA